MHFPRRESGTATWSLVSIQRIDILSHTRSGKGMLRSTSAEDHTKNGVIMVKRSILTLKADPEEDQGDKSTHLSVALSNWSLPCSRASLPGDMEECWKSRYWHAAMDKPRVARFVLHGIPSRTLGNHEIKVYQTCRDARLQKVWYTFGPLTGQTWK
jgi:hypothetical protein